MTTRYTRDVVVVGASAGGVEALCEFARGLPVGLAASVLVVLHLPAGGTSALPSILSRAGPLPAVSARQGLGLEHGKIYVASPNHHMLVVDGSLAVSHGPTENGHRPAINALFRSAAIVCGPRVTGVLLSGVLDDGVAGLLSIASRGGRVVVQDPDEALYPSMPVHALQALRVDHVLAAGAMGGLLDKICHEEVEPGEVPAPSRLLYLENEIANTNPPAPLGDNPGHLGPQSGLTCPDCDGALAEVAPDGRYRCRVGHAWTAEALLDAKGMAWERALWTAVRTLDEKAALSRRLGDRARERGNSDLAGRYDQIAEEATAAARLLGEPMRFAGRGEPEVSD